MTKQKRNHANQQLQHSAPPEFIETASLKKENIANKKNKSVRNKLASTITHKLTRRMSIPKENNHIAETLKTLQNSNRHTKHNEKSNSKSSDKQLHSNHQHQREPLLGRRISISEERRTSLLEDVRSGFLEHSSISVSEKTEKYIKNVHEDECIKLIKNFEKQKNKEYKTMILITGISIFIAFCLATKIIFSENSFNDLKINESGIEIPFPIYMMFGIISVFMYGSVIAKEFFSGNPFSMLNQFITNTKFDQTQISVIQSTHKGC